ncbi:endonuclease/exonuclease/phosphatase family protein [Labedella populi]|uniref:Endonuclease/exonuclease/phosphatase family protein n=2 Tax=Labedella populi TaxID=2498850 RepID=A0A3S3ZZZ3_9MICO|nr:endonuclease/exonuclease/phosphatase family protein [Labedella populi]
MTTAAGTALIGAALTPDLHVMTFNVRRPLRHLTERSPDLWTTRRPALGALLAAERPTVLGTQEVVPEQAAFVKRALGERYRRIGHGRGRDRRGEGCPIFFDTERLHLEDWSQQALSDSPEAPGSTGWGNMVPRILVRAVFRDRTTSARFLVVNTHFDHLSRRSRMRSADRIRALVAEAGLPSVVMGDLNTGAESSPIRALLTERGERRRTLVDAWSAASERLTPSWGTFPNYREPRTGRKRIDWILTTADVEVVRAAINPARPSGVWASDHLPVQVVMRLPSTRATEP